MNEQMKSWPVIGRASANGLSFTLGSQPLHEWNLSDKIHETGRDSCTGPAPKKGQNLIKPNISSNM